jgi:tetratricopeptide (TPR) repeat protein
MKSLITALLLAFSATSYAQTHGGQTADSRPVTLRPGMGSLHHPIQTSSGDAQAFFDQGLTFVFAFNHEEAVRSFRKAGELDAASPMPHWGIALALGPNINQEVDRTRELEAYEAAQHARSLAEGAPDRERAYVEAILTRYSNDPDADLKALAARYADAMRALSERYPDDLDAATLYAESLMDLRPWQLWTNEGAPAEGTLEIVAVLESVLQRDPGHIGANHYYIHATEASVAPDRALPSAQKLETLVPAAGHLVHMPAHVYMRTGNYAAAVAANAKGAAVDREYIESTSASGFYPTMYYNHNLDFLASAAMMTGQLAEASKAASEVVANVTPLLSGMPMLEPFAAKQIFVLLRFAKWNDVLQLPAPDPEARLLTSMYHFGRGVAHAALGAAAEAEADRASFQAAVRAVPAGTAWLYNTADTIFAVADAVLDARILGAQGRHAEAIAAWEKAVAAEDALSYDEPPDWYYSTRESLGAALLRQEQYNEARRVFREDLERHPESPRSLFGLWNALRGISPEDPMVSVVNRRFMDAWERADVQLTLADY